jgi:hypothetical protein
MSKGLLQDWMQRCSERSTPEVRIQLHVPTASALRTFERAIECLRLTMLQILFRFLVGGMVVSLFAALADCLKPKSFAGLFGAAPSVALATIGLTILHNGTRYATLEARSMIAGAIAFFLYAQVCCYLMAKRYHAKPVAISSLLLWLAFAIGLWAAALR